MTEEQLAALIAAALGGGNDKSNTATTATYKDYVKLNYAAAKSLLQQVAEDIQYTGKFTPEEIRAFVELFSTESNKQIETIVKTAREKVTPGATAEDIKKAVSNVVTTKTLSFFDPKSFASDYLWGKINFKDEATLGGRAIGNLQQVRGLVKDFNLFGISDAEIQKAAKDISMGKMSLNDYKALLREQAKIQFPTFAARFDATPDATTRDFALPIMKVIADEWEMDVNSVGFDEPLVEAFTLPKMVDGKMVQPSVAEIRAAARKSPKFDLTTKIQQKINSQFLSYSKIFGKKLAQLANQDPKILAITAAMPSGTGLDEFAKIHPKKISKTMA
jgi:hypothetical protein